MVFMKKQRVIIFHELHVGVEFYHTENHNGYPGIPHDEELKERRG